MKAVIIEDEINCRELLSTMLEDYCDGVAVVGTAEDVEEGIRLIQEHRPELVFLDIEMPGGDGFDVLKAFPEPFFQVIFVSGYQNEGLETLVQAALAWVQKPLDLQELQKAIQQSGLLPPTSPAQLRMLSTPKKQGRPSELTLATAGSYECIPFEQVAYLKAQGSYTAFYLRNGEERIASHSLGHYEKIFPQKAFFRTHKSFIVNLKLVEAHFLGRNGLLTLKGGTELPVAARRKADFLRCLEMVQSEEQG